VFANNTERIFRFVINNTISSAISDIMWSLDTGESTINSENNITLQSNEDAFVFVYYNYTSSGNYTVVATTENGQYIDIEEMEVVI